MTPAHPLYDLLHDWSNVEPDRVVLTIGSTIAVRVKGNAFGVSVPGVVLAAVIEAIEARGWWWKLHRYGTWPHLVRGHVGPDPLSAVPRLGEGPTPAAALLTAYLAALEAEADQ